MAHLEGAGNPLLPSSANIQFAVASSGLILDENYFGLPLHATDIASIRAHIAMFLQAYNIEFNVQIIRSAADEMELFGVINRNFSRIFLEQEEKRTFKTYDAPSAIAEKWGVETPNRAMKKPANWLQFIKLKPQRNAYLVESMTTLRCAGNVDEILRSLSAFFKINKPEHVQGALRNHAMLVKNPPIIHSASLVKHRQGMKISEIYRKIFSNPELYKEKRFWQRRPFFCSRKHTGSWLTATFCRWFSHSAYVDNE
ncbi:unnamed protein product [Hymenolepis diminuta]|uniref:Uncharacterized protein n=2 Tax=Hymenolepis diminuta TaxID=6216 RepID=A0A564Y5R5_HYMDI|nr:unnamed protein product [Hymenolepis diminuta]